MESSAVGPNHVLQAEMTMTVLLHVDRATDYQPAISLLRHPEHGERTYVRVLAVDPELDGLADEAMRALQPHFAEVTHGTRTGEPSTEILQAAEEIEADLIVLGTGTEAGRRPGLGPVARQVVVRAATPVLVARPIGPRREGAASADGSVGPFRILVATDGSPCAVAAATMLSDPGPPPDAETVVLSVIERSRPLFTPRVAPTCQAELRRALRESGRRARCSAGHPQRAVLDRQNVFEDVALVDARLEEHVASNARGDIGSAALHWLACRGYGRGRPSSCSGAGGHTGGLSDD